MNDMEINKERLETTQRKHAFKHHTITLCNPLPQDVQGAKSMNGLKEVPVVQELWENGLMYYRKWYLCLYSSVYVLRSCLLSDHVRERTLGALKFWDNAKWYLCLQQLIGKKLRAALISSSFHSSSLCSPTAWLLDFSRYESACDCCVPFVLQMMKPKCFTLRMAQRRNASLSPGQVLRRDFWPWRK